jgi:hypothetical protein
MKNKYSFNNFIDTVDKVENDCNSAMTRSVHTALSDVNAAYLAIMKRKTVTKSDIEAFKMIIEMAELAKNHLEEINKKES